MTSGRFALGVHPRPGESLPGYLMRFAARVGTDANRLAGMAGLRQPGCGTSTANLERLATLANAPTADLKRLAYRPSGRFAHHRFLAGTIHREMLDISARKACPGCLREHDHHRAAWDLALLTACPVHRIRLVARCPGCGRKPGWCDPAVVTCRCGSDLREWPTSSVTVAEAQADERLLALAAGGDLEWLPPVLRGCDPSDLVRLAMCLGMFRTGWRKERRVETLCAAGPEVVARIVGEGIRSLAEWPFPLLDFLAEEREQASGRPGRYGAKKVLGPFYTWLRDVEPDPVREALLAVVRDSVRTNPVLAQRMLRSDLIAGVEEADRASHGEVIGIVQAAAILGRSHASMTRLLAGGILPGGASEGRGVPLSIDGASVRELARREAGTLTLEQAATRLGVSKARTRRILDSGGLRVGRQLGAGRSSRRVIDADDLQALLTELEGRAPPRGADADTVGFEHAAEALRRRGVETVGMLAMVRDGRLPAASVDDGMSGLKRLRFERETLKALCRGFGSGPLLTVQATAERLGLKWEVVAHLVRQGLLPGSDQGIAPEEVERFSRNFVSGAELAKERQTSPRALAATLAVQGVVPVSGPGVDGGRQNFFRRK